MAAHWLKGVYLGVWREGREYHAGDFVTRSGSLWHCNRDTAERPGTSPARTLAVKKGERLKIEG